MLSYGWMEIGVLFSTAYARSVRHSPARMPEDACATRQLHCQWCCGRVVDVTPHLLQTLFQFISVVHPRLLHSLLDDAPDPVINRIKVMAVRWPKIRWNGRRRCLLDKSHSVACPVCWGIVLSKDEEFPKYLAHHCFDKNQKLKQTISMYVTCNKTVLKK